MQNLEERVAALERKCGTYKSDNSQPSLYLRAHYLLQKLKQMDAQTDLFTKQFSQDELVRASRKILLYLTNKM